MDELIALLDLEYLEENLFRGISPKSSWKRVFGGQVVAQALVAAQRTVPPERYVHSLHGYFMLPGDPEIPIVFSVDRIRDGQSFTTRRVVAIQKGQAIFSLEASFHRIENGLDYQHEIPADIPPPEELPSRLDLIERYGDRLSETIRKYLERKRPIELRPVDLMHYRSRERLPPKQNIWLKPVAPVPDDRNIQSAVIAFLSDMTILDTATFPHGLAVFDPSIQAASLDHAIWFHRPSRLDDWLLFTQDTPSSSGGRGFSRGLIYERNGMLVASVVQEGLIRLRRGKNDND